IESGSNDPMAIFLTVALVTLLASGDAPSWQIGVFFVQQMGIGLLGGVLGGRLLAWLVNRIRLAEGLYPLLALAGGLFLFGLVGQAGGSGFLAIYAAGIVFGNRPVHAREDILGVHDGLAWLAQIVMFLVLGLLAAPSALVAVAPAALLVSAGMMFVARPLAVWLSLLAHRAPFAEKLFISWVGLRGAVPVVLALFPLMGGLAHAQLYFNVAFFVVLTSLVFQGWTIAPLARLLKLELPPVFAARQRVALDIGGSTGFELVGYQVPPGSRLDGADADELNLAEDERLVAAFRGERTFVPDAAARLAGGDLVYLLVRSENVDAVSGRFAAGPLPEPLAERRFFGDFGLDPAARLADVCLAYGVAPPADLADLSLAEVIARRCKGVPVVGDRVTLGDIDLVVRETAGKSIARVGLVLHPPPARADGS
ncbi:MAG: potassium/proton antiporter, partial [Rhodocyclaceae bacterium]|nr:potassium/proton antiporter [Rhodocyclaceae bacterium]